ncbi:MAG: hypothetical protein HYT30_01800 [Parcubacteria group bacterium]|nr:hypothetical protein [Parcubacteria group bacterium]
MKELLDGLVVWLTTQEVVHPMLFWLSAVVVAIAMVTYIFSIVDEVVWATHHDWGVIYCCIEAVATLTLVLVISIAYQSALVPLAMLIPIWVGTIITRIVLIGIPELYLDWRARKEFLEWQKKNGGT